MLVLISLNFYVMQKGKVAPKNLATQLVIVVHLLKLYKLKKMGLIKEDSFMLVMQLVMYSVRYVIYLPVWASS